jgi:hypothetical protein
MHPDAVFIIIAFSALAIAAAIIVTLLRRHARPDPDPPAAPPAQGSSRPDVDS